MATPLPLYQEVERQIAHSYPTWRITAVRRLALLVTGIIAAESCVLTQVAIHLAALGLTQAQDHESIQRRLRRTLNAKGLADTRGYRTAAAESVDWEAFRRSGQRVILIVDESDQDDRLHLLRLSLAYRGSSLPLAWAVGKHNAHLSEGQYWEQMDQVLDQAAALVPQDLPVLVVADRAYDIPPFVDRCAKRGWHWAVRAKANSELRWRDRRGRERPLKEVVRERVSRPGKRFKERGKLFKKAGWREASVVALWAAGCEEPLVVVTDLAPRWDVIAWYDRRFWTECGFRNDKKRGWKWEDCQVRGVEHHQRMLAAMAWATLVMLCLGAEQATQRLAELGQRQRRRSRATGRLKPVGKPQPAHWSLFSLGLQRACKLLYQRLACTLRWRLPDLGEMAWTVQWYRAQSLLFLFQTVRS